jgi:excisionase family DNA binding protein
MERSDETSKTKGHRVVSARGAAKLLGVDKRTVRRLLQQAKIKGRKTPERWEIPLSEVRRWARFRAVLHASENLFTMARAARELGISRQAVHQQVHGGRLRSRIVGSRRFIPREALEEQLRKRKEEGSGGSKG